MTDYVPRLERLARIAHSRPTLLAGLLRLYQEQEELDAAALGAFLQADAHALTLLALCRRPRMDVVNFHSDVEQIADYTHVNAAQLARLVQTAVTYEAGAMQTTKHRFDFSYTPDELQALFALARQQDVDDGGRYDARSAAINIWTHGWRHQGTWEESATMGTLYFQWGDHMCSLWQIECDEGFESTDLLWELGVLEEKSLGRRIHGSE